MLLTNRCEGCTGVDTPCTPFVASVLCSRSSCRICLLLIDFSKIETLVDIYCGLFLAVGSCGRRNKVPSDENTEHKRSPFKALSRSVYIATHATLTARDFFLAYFVPFRSIHLHFVRNLPRFFQCWLWLTHGSSVGPRNNIGHPFGSRFPC